MKMAPKIDSPAVFPRIFSPFFHPGQPEFRPLSRLHLSVQFPPVAFLLKSYGKSNLLVGNRTHFFSTDCFPRDGENKWKKKNAERCFQVYLYNCTEPKIEVRNKDNKNFTASFE